MTPRPPAPPNDALRERFGINLRASRKRLGLSQEAFGFRAEVHPRSLSPFELGQRLPRIESFIRLAGALKVRPNDLVEGISWTPGEVIVTPGEFVVPDDPELAAEIATLRASAYERGKRRGRG
jgi:transcriptional regulator with XRE-family HTH domain